MVDSPIQRIGLIGFGEAGQIFGRDLARAGVDVSAFDILIGEPQKRDAMLQRFAAAKVRVTASLQDVVADAELVISLVTASAATDVATQTATLLRSGQFFLDANSVSPDTKKIMAREFASSKADFVEAAVMSPVPPQGYKAPILLGGSRAQELSSRLRLIGMDTTAVSECIGVASAIKMCRSVIMKGLNALVIESLFAARRYGAEDAVLASLDVTYPNMGWAERLPDMMIYRATEHSRRRASEMREVAQALSSAGIKPLMSSAAAEVQEWLTKCVEESGLGLGTVASFSWREFVDGLAKTKTVEIPS